MTILSQHSFPISPVQFDADLPDIFSENQEFCLWGMSFTTSFFVVLFQKTPLDAFLKKFILHVHLIVYNPLLFGLGLSKETLRILTIVTTFSKFLRKRELNLRLGKISETFVWLCASVTWFVMALSCCSETVLLNIGFCQPRIAGFCIYSYPTSIWLCQVLQVVLLST